jgi:hypothetical protein
VEVAVERLRRGAQRQQSGVSEVRQVPSLEDQTQTRCRVSYAALWVVITGPGRLIYSMLPKIHSKSAR